MLIAVVVNGDPEGWSGFLAIITHANYSATSLKNTELATKLGH